MRVADESRERTGVTEDAATSACASSTQWLRSLCADRPMMNTMAKGFESLGIRRKQIRWEQLNIR